MHPNNSGNPRNDFLNVNVSRRALLKSSLLGSGATVASVMFGGLIPAAALGADASSKYEGPVVETTAGKVRGIIQGGTHIFRGIPYGASTAGSNRFMPPRRPEAWTGVREAFQNGHSSPQVAPAPGAIGWGLRGSAQQGEDCLVLNVFTNGVNDGRKRPVMMWIHG